MHGEMTSAHLGFPGGPDVRQALERSPMPAHARRGHPIKVGARASQEPWRAAHRGAAQHVRVPAPVIDQCVQLPALVGQRPRAERLLDRGTLPRGQGLGGLPFAQTIGRLLGSRRGILWALGQPLPAPPGRFPLDTGRIQAWTSHAVPLRLDLCVTMWDVIWFQAYCVTHAGMTPRPLCARGHGSPAFPTGYRPATCAKAASVWGNQNVMSIP
jgi:hypothetical protein